MSKTCNVLIVFGAEFQLFQFLSKAEALQFAKDILEQWKADRSYSSEEDELFVFEPSTDSSEMVCIYSSRVDNPDWM